MGRFSRHCFVLVNLALLTSFCFPTADGEQEELADEQAGLVATYRSAAVDSPQPPQVERIDARVAFDWAGSSPDRRLPAGPFEAEWVGTILIRDDIDHVWHAELQGAVRVIVAEQVILDHSSSSRTFVSSQPVKLDVGEYPIRIEYRSEGDACLKLFWSAASFTLEPLPSDVLFHKPLVQRNLAQQGEWLADSLRCTACHSSQTTFETLAAPSLRHVTSGNSRNVLLQRLLKPHTVVRNSRMPDFGFSHSEARAIAAYLESVDAAIDVKSPPKPKAEDEVKGHLLLHSLGCVICHELPQPLSDSDQSSLPDGSAAPADSHQKTMMPFEGPSLVDVSNRRTAAWIFQWLKAPQSLNPTHRMPVFSLNDNELRELTAVLAMDQSGQADANRDAEKELVDAGKALINQAGCVKCHEIPGIDAHRIELRPIDRDSIVRASDYCLRNHTNQPASNSVNTRSDNGPSKVERNGKLVPKFSLSSKQFEQLQHWFGSYAETTPVVPRMPESTGSATRGRYLLTARGCAACHDRDGARGISALAAQLESHIPELKGQSENLIPPQLTAAGDRIEPGYLLRAVSGVQNERRLPWLQIRMPRFTHSSNDAESLVKIFIAEDQIPDAADSVRPEIVRAAVAQTASTEDLLDGNALVGAAGFNCVACHKAGAFEPRFVAPGTRGSDLMTMGTRIRPKYFQRWMKNPIRVMTGIEMPAIRRPAPGIANETLEKQFEVLWRALKDPRFTPPTVVSRYEQYWTVLPGQRPRIVRDVFTLNSDRSDSIARTFAAGFGNGHHLFFDLDSMQPRLWSIGEFARQRTEGKSWFWDPAGIPVAKSGPMSAHQHWIELWQINNANALNDSRPVLTPVTDEGRSVELIRYQSGENEVRMWYRVYFRTAAETVGAPKESSPHLDPPPWTDPSNPVQSILIEEILAPVETPNESGTNGVSRKLYLRETIAQHEVAIRIPELSDSDAFQPTTTIEGNHETAPVKKAGDEHQWYRLSVDHPLTWQATITANSEARPIPVKPVLKAAAESITSVPGFSGQRLPLDASIMPTSMTWLPDGRLAFTSLRGHVWIARDSDGDHLEDELTLFEEGLAAPFGILADGNSILVAHKPEILRLTDTDGDGRADEREVVASGWGYSDDYHDWTTGLVRDSNQNLYVGLGSDYSQKQRANDRDRWRGTVLKVDPSGIRTPVAFSFRYPMGLAIDASGHLFATDNQGVQNTFNEINHIQTGRHYGVPSRNETVTDAANETPAIQIPHPWTRSVNSIQFLSNQFASAGMQDHGIGCEYDLRFLVRFTMQQVGSTMQGCVYPFSRPEQPAGGPNFIGPVSSAVAPDGAIYIGSIWDSGWQGGQNTGAIERIEPVSAGSPEPSPNGIREIRAVHGGFEIEFFRPVDRIAAQSADNFSVLGYTRIWGGSYATPDSDRYQCQISKLTLSEDARTVVLEIEQLKQGFVYEISVKAPLDSQPMWPTTAAYTLKQIP